MSNRKSKQSKRVSFGKKLAIAKRVRDTFRKQQKLLRRRQRSEPKVPRSLLLTEAEREQLRSIKRETDERTEEWHRDRQPMVAPHLEELTARTEETDWFVEVVDARAPEDCRDRQSEMAVMAAQKPLYVWLTHSDEYLCSIVAKQLESTGMLILTDLDMLARMASEDGCSLSRICIFGKPKTGKFTLRTQLESVLPSAATSVVKIPQSENTLSSVLRGAVSQDTIDPLFYFKRALPSLDLSALTDFYRLPVCYKSLDFLTALGDRLLANEKKAKRRQEAAATRFIRDASENRIQWACVDGGYVFRL